MKSENVFTFIRSRKRAPWLVAALLAVPGLTAVSVGNVWQRQARRIDEERARRGIGIEPGPILGKPSVRKQRLLEFELLTATEGYRITAEALA